MIGPAPSPAEDLHRTLREEFGFRRLRHGQEAVMRAVLAGRDTLAVMPTGAGKSLCYQLPGLELEGTTVIVSPLISLMKDQVDKLVEMGHAARRLDSTVGAADERETLAELEAGDIEFLFVTPERMARDGFLELLAWVPLDFVVIDEAHCVSRWGHDFRPDYLELGRALDRLGRPPFLALTATAGPEVVADVREHLHAPDLEVVETGLYRPNLRLEVALVEGDDAKRERVEAALEEIAGSAIVYVATVRHAEELTEHLAGRGFEAELYTGRLARARREEVQDRFMGGELPIVVATNAFGMGIDKPDIRLVVHYDLPASPDSYYQEAGRAGRDGDAARCLLTYDPADAGIQKALLAHGNGNGRKRDAESAEERAEADRARLARMEQYAQTALCRWANLTAYFDQGRDEPRGWWCGHCDNCERHGEGEALGARRLPATPEVEPVTAEPLPSSGNGHGEAVELAVGSPVSVPLYGEGRVKELDSESVTVSFRDGSVRRVRRLPRVSTTSEGAVPEPPPTKSHGGVMKIGSLQDLFVDELKDAYDFEHQIIEALPKMAEAARDPELQKGFRQHLEQTKDQVERLEEVFRELGEEPERKTCDGMKGLLEEGEEFVKAKGDQAAKDAALVGAAQRVEHYEMAAYGTLRAFAETLGHDKAAKILQGILDQEAETDERLTKLAQTRINPRAAEGASGERKSGSRKQGESRRASGNGSGSGNGEGDLTKEELYERAQELGIEGRSKMSKQELQRAVERQS